MIFEYMAYGDLTEVLRNSSEQFMNYSASLPLLDRVSAKKNNAYFLKSLLKISTRCTRENRNVLLLKKRKKKRFRTRCCSYHCKYRRVWSIWPVNGSCTETWRAGTVWSAKTCVWKSPISEWAETFTLAIITKYERRSTVARGRLECQLILLDKSQ